MCGTFMATWNESAIGTTSHTTGDSVNGRIGIFTFRTGGGPEASEGFSLTICAAATGMATFPSSEMLANLSLMPTFLLSVGDGRNRGPMTTVLPNSSIGGCMWNSTSCTTGEPGLDWNQVTMQMLC